MSNNLMSLKSTKQALACAVEKRKVRKHPLSCKKFRHSLWEEAIKKKINSFDEIKEQYEDFPKDTTLFVEGLMNYTRDNSNHPFGFYPEGIIKIENCYPDDDTWKVRLTYNGVNSDRTFDATIRIIEYGRAVDAIEEYLKDDHLCFTELDFLKQDIDEKAITDMMNYLEETNYGGDEEDEEQKIFECEECPICYEKLNMSFVMSFVFLPNAFVPKCGHPVCLECKKNIDKCPTCRGPLEINGKYYDDAKEFLENEVEEAARREDNERLAALIDVRALALRCFEVESDDISRLIGFEYGVDWAEDHYWILRED